MLVMLKLELLILIEILKVMGVANSFLGIWKKALPEMSLYQYVMFAYTIVYDNSTMFMFERAK